MNMPATLTSESVMIDPVYHTCTIRRQPVTLTACQFAILYALMEHPHQVFTRKQIIVAAKGSDYSSTPKSVDVAIHTLRLKIGRGLVETVRGVGYRFAEDLTETGSDHAREYPRNRHPR